MSAAREKPKRNVEDNGNGSADGNGDNVSGVGSGAAVAVYEDVIGHVFASVVD